MEWISACNADQPMCLEVAFLEGGEVLLRSSTNPQSTITVTDGEFETFLAGAKSGQFDRP